MAKSFKKNCKKREKFTKLANTVKIKINWIHGCEPTNRGHVAGCWIILFISFAVALRSSQVSTDHAHLPYLNPNSISSNFQHSISSSVVFLAGPPPDSTPRLRVSLQVGFLIAFLPPILVLFSPCLFTFNGFWRLSRSASCFYWIRIYVFLLNIMFSRSRLLGGFKFLLIFETSWLPIFCEPIAACYWNRLRCFWNKGGLSERLIW